MPKAKTPSLLDEARAIPASKSRLRWDERLTPAHAQELRELIDAKRSGEVDASYLALGKLLVRRFSLKSITHRQVAQDLGELVRGDA